MRIHICHKTEYHYDAPPGGVIQTLRLTPRNHEGQYVANWRVEVSADCRLHQQEDAFGNIIHAFTAEGPFTALTVLAEGEVETQATGGLVRGGVERFPPTLFLRETPLTRADAAITSFARTARSEGNKDTLAVLHVLLAGLGKEMAYDTLLSQSARQRGLFRPDYVCGLLDEHCGMARDHHTRLWALLMLELWFRMWIDAPANEAVMRPAA